MQIKSILPLKALVLLSAINGTSAEDWPQFRGVNAGGISTSRGLPTEFSFEDKVLWQQTLGDGIGSSVIANGRVFNTAMTAENTYSVFAHDASTGKELWRRDFAVKKLPRITPPNSHASSTPAVDDERVYVYFSTIGLIALNVGDGQEAWTHKLRTPAYLMDWGTGSSPIVYGDSVFFAMDDDLLCYVTAVNKKTGDLQWKTPREDMLAGYAIPVLCTANGRTDLVVSGTGKLKGYDPATGKERWTCNTLLRTMMTSPVVRDDVIYIAVQSYGDATRTVKFALLEWLDTNQDKQLSKPETPQEFWVRFDVSDRNKDGFLDDKELDTAFQHPDNQVGGGSIVQAIRGGGNGDVTKTHVVWNINSKAPSNLSSPLVVNNRVYTVKTGGLLSCFDAYTGKTLWERTRIQNLGDYYASPIAADGKVFIAGRNGFVVVIEDAPQLKILAKNDMGEEIFANPSIADGRLFIRTREKVFCIAADGKSLTGKQP